MKKWYCNPNATYTAGPGHETLEVTEVTPLVNIAPNLLAFAKRVAWLETECTCRPDYTCIKCEANYLIKIGEK